jgi:hypothetical protein
MMGLRRANPSEKFHRAMGPEFVFIAHSFPFADLFVNQLLANDFGGGSEPVLVRRLDVSAKQADHHFHC